MTDPIRRSLTTLPFALMATGATAAIPTPRAAEGPYYPTHAMRLSDDDANLIRIEGAVRNAGGGALRARLRLLSN